MTDRLRLAIFDCDGTLVDSGGHIVAEMQAAFTALEEEPPSDPAIRDIIGLSLHEAIFRLAPHLPETRIFALTEAYKRHFADKRDRGIYDDEPPLYSGCREALMRIDQTGALLGVATGKNRRGLKHTLAAHALAPRFVITQTADDAPGKVPA